MNMKLSVQTKHPPSHSWISRACAPNPHLSIVMLIIGLILSLVFVMCKGASIYASRNEMEDSDEEEEETKPAE